MPKLEVLEKYLGAWAKTDPVVRYLRTSWRYYRKQKRNAFTAVASANKGTLIGMLASYRDALDAATYTNDAKALRKRFEDFVADYKATDLRYVLAYRIAAKLRYKAPLDAAAVWKLVGKGVDADAWTVTAAYEAGRVLYNGRKYSEAAAHFEKLLFASKGTPMIDYTVVNSFRNGGGGLAGWRMFWTRWRERVLRTNDAYQLLALLGTARIAGESGDYDRIIARITRLKLDDAATVAAVASTLRGLKRNHQALALLQPWVHAKGKRAPVPALVELASWITETQGRLSEAAGYLEQAMSAYYKKPVSLGVMRRDYTRLIRLYTRMAQAAPKPERKKHVVKVLRAAAEWRLVDPDNPEIDRQAAALLFSVQRNGDAWRYLSTAIERHPMEGSAYKTVADALEKEGRVGMAEPLWRRAVEVEPTNPTWLLRHAQALYALGRAADAKKRVDEILAKKWHNRFFRVTYQAKNFKRLYAR